MHTEVDAGVAVEHGIQHHCPNQRAPLVETTYPNGEAKAVGSMGRHETIGAATIIIDKMQLVHDGNLMRRTGTLYPGFDDACADLIGEGEDKGSEEEQQDELHPLLLLHAVACLKLSTGTIGWPGGAHGIAVHDEDDYDVERNPSDNFAQGVPEGVLKGASIVVEPEHQLVIEGVEGFEHFLIIYPQPRRCRRFRRVDRRCSRDLRPREWRPCRKKDCPCGR